MDSGASAGYAALLAQALSWRRARALLFCATLQRSGALSSDALLLPGPAGLSAQASLVQGLLSA